MADNPFSEVKDNVPPSLFHEEKGNDDLLTHQDTSNIVGQFGPASSPLFERRATFERLRGCTAMGTSVESYIGEYTYYIGQSKYYNIKKRPEEDVVFGREIDNFFRQETDDGYCEKGPIYLQASSSQKVQDYLKNQMTSIVKNITDTKEEDAVKDDYDILGVSVKGRMECEYPEYMANSILSALTLMQSKKSPPSLNFNTNVRFFNLIVYFRDVPDELDANISLPQTAITIIGNTLKELIISNKSWIITDGLKQPFANLLGDALIKAKKREKELTKSLRKRLHLTGILLKKIDTKSKRREINVENKETPDLYPLTLKEQKQLDEVISPYSGMSIWLALEKFIVPNLKEKVIWHISQLLKIPAVVVSLEPPTNVEMSQQMRITKLRVEVLCPHKEEIPRVSERLSDTLEASIDGSESRIGKWSSVFDLQSKQTTLHSIILKKANAYFDIPLIDFSKWNTITPSIFLQSAKSVHKRLENFQPEDSSSAVDAKIIDRTIRYALIFGNRDVVETIMNSTSFQRIVLKRREKIVEDIYFKASQEVFLFSRVILAIKGPDYKLKNEGLYGQIKTFLQKFFERIFGRGFIWEPAYENEIADLGDDDDNHFLEDDKTPSFSAEKELTEEQKNKLISSKNASQCFFPEFVFVWAILCLKFDVALLFLEYSGVHRQDLKHEQVYVTNKGIYQMGNALAASRILKGMSQLLKEDSSISKEEHETMTEHACKYENIAVDLLNEALTHGTILKDIFEQKLPFWGDITLINLAQQAKLSNFFSERSITRHVNNEWEGLNRLTTKSEKDLNLWVETVNHLKSFWLPESIKFLLKRVVTPRNTFFFHVSFYILFLIMLTLLICFYWRVCSGNDCDSNIEKNRDIIFILYIVYVVTNYIDEIYQYKRFVVEKYKNRGKSNKQNWEKVSEYIKVFKAALVEYMSSIWNLLDLIIVLGFVISVVTYYIFRDAKSSPDEVNPFEIVRIYFGLFSTLFYIRFFQYILIFPGIGPLVYVCFLAFKRMLYFLIIIVLVALCFGIAEVALTSPAESTNGTTIELNRVARRLIVYTFYPYYQIFGEYFLEDFINDSFPIIILPNTSKVSIFGSETAASFWLRTQILTYIAIMIWILIANVLLLNLMIAYFSQIYEDVAKNAASIYLLNFLEIVDEYKEKSFFPAPLNLFSYAYKLVYWCVHIRKKKVKDERVETKRRQTEGILAGMVKRRHFRTKTVSFGWHFELSFSDYYWKKVGEERYAKKAEEENTRKMIAAYLKAQKQEASKDVFV